MTKDTDEYAVREIVIVRRVHDGGDDHGHGAVWKIAYADFMTAMMAFFLVMWLINAANEETKQAVASYFSPLKLMDVTSNPKGVLDPKLGASRHEEAVTAEEAVADSETGEHPISKGETASGDEAGLFRDPYAVLAAIAGEEGSGPGSKAAREETSGIETSAETVLDPLDPNYWQTNVDAEERAADRSDKRKSESSHELPVMESKVAERSATMEASAKQIEAALEGEKGTAENASSAAAEAGEPNASQSNHEQETAKKLQSKILVALSEVGITDKIPVSVEIVDEGVLVSVTENLDFEMFDVGSAKPRKDLVLALGSIGAVLATNKGDIIVRGHTDGRAYRSAEYDNWRLSASRAQMAYHMLVRGGLAEMRVKRIEGHADRQLRDEVDPLSASNRRIEILIVP